MRALNLLIVEDDPLFGRALQDALEGPERRVRLAASGAEALEAIVNEGFDLILQDVQLPDINGLDLLKELLNRQPHCGALVMTGYGTIDTAVEAMKIGAFDFLTKPFPIEILLLRIESYCEYKSIGRDAGYTVEETPFSRIVTRSPAMRAALEVAASVAMANAPVLLQGESGTGKDLAAQAIHAASNRRNKPFVPVNCAAIPPTLIESELFGVEKGAYTGADRSRPGYIEMADGGTLFLDEIGELPLDMQGKLLRVLETKVVTRVGGRTYKHQDFRLVSATNRDLSVMVKNGQFRGDLFFRINVVPVCIPPLRERKEDIPLLLAHFVDKFCERSAFTRPVFSPEALDLLYNYGYPGNVREMQNIVQRIALLYPGMKILRQHLPTEVQLPMVIGSQFESFPVGKPLKEAVAEYEKRYIEKVVLYAGGRKTLAAHILGLSRKVLWEKLKK